MTTLIVPNAWQVKFAWHDADATYSNVVGMDVGTLPPLTQAAADEAAASVAAAFTASGIDDILADEVVLDELVVTDLRTEGAPQYVGVVSSPGTNAADRLPDQLAIVVTLRTALRTKSGRGRIYMGGFCESSSDSAGNIVGATATAVADFWNAIKSAWSGDSYSGDLGVISRKDPAFGYTGTIRPVTSLEVRDNKWDSQRRRSVAS